MLRLYPYRLCCGSNTLLHIRGLRRTGGPCLDVIIIMLKAEDIGLTVLTTKFIVKTLPVAIFRALTAVLLKRIITGQTIKRCSLS